MLLCVLIGDVIRYCICRYLKLYGSELHQLLFVCFGLMVLLSETGIVQILVVMLHLFLLDNCLSSNKSRTTVTLSSL